MTALKLSRRRHGFTVLELMVALTVGSILIVLTHSILGTATMSAEVVAATSHHRDREFNGRRWLRAAFGSLAAPSDESPFIGLRESMTFSASIRNAGGWLAPDRLHLQLRNNSLIASGTSKDTLVLADSIQAMAMDYLLYPGAESRWTREWISRIKAPLAVRLRLVGMHPSRDRVDTLLFLLQDRR
jgi:prepilin-type N-terminal cleavage/methylation domain-containing protein